MKFSPGGTAAWTVVLVAASMMVAAHSSKLPTPVNEAESMTAETGQQARSPKRIAKAASEVPSLTSSPKEALKPATEPPQPATIAAGPKVALPATAFKPAVAHAAPAPSPSNATPIKPAQPPAATSDPALRNTLLGLLSRVVDSVWPVKSGLPLANNDDHLLSGTAQASKPSATPNTADSQTNAKAPGPDSQAHRSAALTASTSRRNGGGATDSPRYLHGTAAGVRPSVASRTTARRQQYTVQQGILPTDNNKRSSPTAHSKIPGGLRVHQANRNMVSSQRSSGLHSAMLGKARASTAAVVQKPHRQLLWSAQGAGTQLTSAARSTYGEGVVDTLATQPAFEHSLRQPSDTHPSSATTTTTTSAAAASAVGQHSTTERSRRFSGCGGGRRNCRNGQVPRGSGSGGVSNKFSNSNAAVQPASGSLSSSSASTDATYDLAVAQQINTPYAASYSPPQSFQGSSISTGWSANWRVGMWTGYPRTVSSVGALWSPHHTVPSGHELSSTGWMFPKRL